MVRACEETSKYLWEMTVTEMKSYSEIFDTTVLDYIDPHNVVKNRRTAGGASFKEVEKQIETEKAYLSR
jgi:argininosuccinate lyase